MLVSTSLNSIPFISSSDSTRLQMSSKQLNQAITSLNCKRPYVISEDFAYLSNSSHFFKKIAPHDGEVIYSNPDLMIVVYVDEQGISKLEKFVVPFFIHTANSFASALRYKRPVGPFNRGDVIYEYDSFCENVPCYGYNLNTMYFPWFGYNFEDAIVLSESAAEECKAFKTKKVYLYLYTNTLLKNIYPNSKYQFIPEIGQKINGNIIISQVNNKNNLQAMNIYACKDFLDDESDIQFNSMSLLCKLTDATITNIKIHKNSGFLIDKNLEKNVLKIKQDYAVKIKQYSVDLKESVGPLTASILFSHYVMNEYKSLEVSLHDLVYVIELDLVKEYPSGIGDKFANR